MATFATRIAEACKGIDTASSVKSNTIAALETFNTSMQAIFTTYGMKNPEKMWFDNTLIKLGRDLEAKMR
jgi:hypothetical protein